MKNKKVQILESGYNVKQICKIKNKNVGFQVCLLLSVEFISKTVGDR
jgi:hypothetical protein